MGKKIGKEKIDMEDEYLYYVGKDGYVWAAPKKMYKGKLRKKKVGTEKIDKKKGHMYYIKNGYVYETKMKNA